MRINFGDSQDNIELDKPIKIYQLRKLIQEKKNIPIQEIHIIKADQIYYQNHEIIDNSQSLTIRQIKNRCPVCQQKSATIVGNCRYCQLNYCSAHRLPESHLCPNMEDCKRQSFEKNSHTVLSGKCVALKI